MTTRFVPELVVATANGAFVGSVDVDATSSIEIFVARLEALRAEAIATQEGVEP